MNAVVALVILTGAGCQSLIDTQPGITIAYKVPCAIVLREQSANPFKIVQQPNVITQAKVVPPYKYPPKKKKKKKKRR